MPIHEEMNDRSRRREPDSEPDTVVHQSACGGHDVTRAAALLEKTEVLSVADAAPPASLAALAAPSLPTRDTLLAGRYELHDVLGRGATGVVYRGRDQLLGRDVAIKLLYADLLDDHQAATRFQQEAQLAARVHHPNAVAIFDTGVHDGQPYIVMECLPGETLASRIATAPLAIDDVLAIGAQLLAALDAAHQQGVIHRDIKPANLLLASNGAVKVADFGIATSVDRTALTTVGSVVGTLAYLAPERLQGDVATEQSDIYAVGVVLYEALTGLKPFSSTTPAALLTEISTGSPIDITDRRSDVSPALADVVMRALEREPQARHASAAAMASALAATNDADVRSTAPPPLAPRPLTASQVAAPVDGGAPAFSARHRRLTAAIAGVVVAVLATIGVAMADRDNFPQTPAVTGGEGSPGAARVDPTTTVVTTTVTTTVRPATTQVTTTVRPATTAPAPAPKGKKKKDDGRD